MSDREICFLTATELSRLVRARELSAGEVLEAHFSQIDRLNPKVNAIVTLVADRARERARAADQALAAGNAVGPLHGLPIAHKDLVWTRGIRTTFGTLACKDFVPTRDALIVERLKQAGAVTIGKTNTPEFGAGSQTFNPVFGETRNPYDTSKTCGGSSGGAAVALACGMQPLADGSDTGGSLRNPANFCNVVGLRPSPGRVPIWPSQAGWYTIGVQGPMARTVRDAALMLSAIAGPDRRSPISIAEAGSRFAAPLERDFRECRIAWSPTLGGLPVDRRVTRVLAGQRQVFESLGCRVEESTPDFKEAEVVFRAWRAWRFELTLSALNPGQQSRLKDTLKQEIEAAGKLSAIDLSRAELRRTRLYHRVREFMETHEFLICPVNQVPPFDVKQPYVEEINGVRMKTYIDWMQSCWTISVLGLPAISVPAGFTPEGLPVGIQIVGRHQDDWGVLQLAHAYEQATGFWKRRPPLCSDGAG